MYAKILFIGVYVLLVATPVQTDDKPSVSLFDVTTLAEPKENELTSTVLWETANMVSKAMRLAPGGKIAEHHHPVFDESLIVYSGVLTVWLNGQKHEVRSGHIAYIPAGTVISGVNASDKETIVIATWATVGREGPLTVSGKPKADKK